MDEKIFFLILEDYAIDTLKNVCWIESASFIG